MKLRYTYSFFFLALVAIAIIILIMHVPRNKNITQDTSNPSQNVNINLPNHMKISSPSFENNTDIPSKFTCDGKNFNPALMISGVPSEAKSLAMIMDDPDAPVARGFVHWVLFNFSPQDSQIAENSVPPNAVQGQNSSGQSRYTGPCPPSGTHHYHFKLFALDGTLTLDSSAKREDVEKAMEGHILDQAELIGLYKRP